MSFIPLKDAFIDMFLDRGNMPQLRLSIASRHLKDFDPKLPHWTLEDTGMTWMERDGIYQFILYRHTDGPHNRLGMRGFGGATFSHTLTDGRTITCDDCWSSRAACLPHPAVDVIVNNTHGWALGMARYRRLIEDLGHELDADNEIIKSDAPQLNIHTGEPRTPPTTQRFYRRAS